MQRPIISEFIGPCSSVERAIKLALSSKNDKKSYSLGPIAHNKNIVDLLEKNNVFVVENIDELASGDTLVISAHGCKKEVYSLATERGINLIDATCPSIIKIHNEVESYPKFTIYLPDT